MLAVACRRMAGLPPARYGPCAVSTVCTSLLGRRQQQHQPHGSAAWAGQRHLQQRQLTTGPASRCVWPFSPLPGTPPRLRLSPCSAGCSRGLSSSNNTPPSIGDLDLPPNLKLSIKCKQLIRDARAKAQAPPPAPPSLTVPVLDLATGEQVDTIDLDPAVFAHEIRRDVVHAVVRWQLACRRQGTAKTKNISEVRGSGKKVRPQKGSGKARAGHKRPPHWRGGARAHGPRGGRDWSYKLHKKVRKMGLRVVLSAKLREGRITVVDALRTETHRTEQAAQILESLGVLDSALLVDGDDVQRDIQLATRALPHVTFLWGGAANCYDMLKRERLVLSRAGVAFLTKKLKP